MPHHTESEAGRRRRAAVPILQNAFRPFFLAAGLTAAAAVPVWAAVYLGWMSPSWADLSMHTHEMLYGFLAAMVCGFALTAIPNWTGRAPVAGLPLAILFGIWLAGRGQVIAPDSPMANLVDLVFLPSLVLIAAREILAGKNWRNLPIVVLLTLFAASHLLFHLDGYAQVAARGTLAVASLLIALIGGRIVPSFTRNWMAGLRMPDVAKLPAPMQGFDKVALAALAVSMAAFTLRPDHAGTGILLVLAGALNLVRLVRWRGMSTVSEPLVWSLHAGYLWVGAGAVLAGLGVVWPGLVPPSAGLHALAAGAVGSMGLAVMTRASLGHTGRSRSAGPATTAIFVLVHAGALLRVAAAIHAPASVLLAAGALAWSAAFLLFVAVYTPILFGPRAT
mgnify:CR=1 FL=1